jgi:hypothetical protein
MNGPTNQIRLTRPQRDFCSQQFVHASLQTPISLEGRVNIFLKVVSLLIFFICWTSVANDGMHHPELKND